MVDELQSRLSQRLGGRRRQDDLPATRVAPDVASSSATTSQDSNAAATTAQAPQSCKPSAIAAVSADLIDFNVNQNAWISSMVISKIGLFGIEWRRTPFFDNKAAFQLGINQVMRRTTTELVDTLGRVRGTSADRPEPAGRPHRARLERGRLVCRLARPDPPDAQRLPRGNRQAARLQFQP